MTASLELLDSAIITAYLQEPARQCLKKLDIFESLDSTNQYLLDQIKINPFAGHVCLAEQQTVGRGRSGRQWFSSFATNLLLSLLWRFDQKPAAISGLSLAVAVAVARALKNHDVPGIQLKWPNDVLADGRKLAGILLEIQAEKGEQYNVVIGIGLNLCTPPQPVTIDQPWTTVQQLIGEKPARNQFAAAVLNALFPVLLEFAAHGLTPFMAEWQRYDVAHNRPVTLLSPQGSLTGICRGINSGGALLFEDQMQRQHTFLSGEISLRF